MEIQQRARNLFPDGVMVSGSNEASVKTTQQLLSDPTVSTIFEATFTYNNYITKADNPHTLFKRTDGFVIRVLDYKYKLG